MAYITYLTNSQQTNSAASHAGWGRTKEEAQAEALYWANQLPWVRTVPLSRAPQWAIAEAREAFHRACLACGRMHPLKERQAVCVDREGMALPFTQKWPVEPHIFEF